MTNEVRIVIDGGYDEIFFCNDFNITTLEEAEAARDNINQLWKQKLEENPHWAGSEAWFRRLAESTVEKFKSGELPLPPTTNANGNTIGKIVGQPPAPAKSAEEANPPVKPETKDEEKEGDGWLDGLQTSLDFAGLAPGLGIFPDLLSAGISLFRGNYMEAGFSLFAAIPVIGDAAGAGKLTYKAGKEIAEEIAEQTAREIAEKAVKKAEQEAAAKAEQKAAEKAEQKAEQKAAEEKAEQGGSSKGKEKDKDDGPCRIGRYWALKCPAGSQAHHIVPDYTLRYGRRRESLKRIKTKPSLPTLEMGMSICLNTKKTGGQFIDNEHKEAHKADAGIRNLGMLSKVPGTIKLSTVKESSILAVSTVKPECALQIAAAVELEFAGIDGDTLVRSDNRNFPSINAIAVLGTIAR